MKIWRDDKMIRWKYEEMTRWQDDKMAWWLGDMVTSKAKIAKNSKSCQGLPEND